MSTVNDLHPAVAARILDALTETSRYSIDHMSIVVRSNGYALHDFVYSFPGQQRVMAAKPFTWRYMKPSAWKEGDVVSLLCLCEISRGFKALTPVAVIEHTNTPENAVNQSRRWNKMLVNDGPQVLLERGLHGNCTVNDSLS